MALPKAARVPRRPARACAKTAEPGKLTSLGAKDHRATPDLHYHPDNCEPAGTIPATR